MPPPTMVSADHELNHEGVPRTVGLPKQPGLRTRTDTFQVIPLASFQSLGNLVCLSERRRARCRNNRPIQSFHGGFCARGESVSDGARIAARIAQRSFLQQPAWEKGNFPLFLFDQQTDTVSFTPVDRRCVGFPKIKFTFSQVVSQGESDL